MERWKVNLYILWISQVVSLMSFGFGLPFLPFYIQTLGVTDPATLKLYTGILSAAPAITMAIMAPIWGILSDRYGRKLMIQRAMFAASIILVLMGNVWAVWQLVVLRFMQGMFSGTITATSAFVASNTPDKKLSYALGVLSSSTFVGYSLGPLIGGIVAEQYGYRTSFIIGAILMFLGFLLVTKMLTEDKNSFSGATKVKKKGNIRALLTPTIVVLLLMLFMQRITRTVFSPFLPLFIQEQLNTLEGASSTTGLINGAVGFLTAFSAIFVSRLGDKYDKINIIQILLGFGLLSGIAINVLDGWWPFLISYCSLFFIIGGVEPLMTSMSAQQVAADKRGLLFGVQGLVSSLGWLVSPTLGTWISIKFGIREVLWVVLSAIIINSTFIFYIKKRQKKRVAS